MNFINLFLLSLNIILINTKNNFSKVIKILLLIWKTEIKYIFT